MIVERGLRFARFFVAGEDRQYGIVRAMRDRNARIGRSSDGRSHSGNDLKRACRVGKGLGLLAAASKQKGIPALEPHNGLPSTGLLDEQGIDLILRTSVRARLFPNVDSFCKVGSPFEKGGIAKVVVDDDLGALETGAPLEGEQAWIARPGTDQIANPRFHEGGNVRRINLPSSMMARAAMAT